MAHRWRLALAFCVLFLLFCPAPGWGQFPTLATVQDTIYNLDGSRFNGYLILEWKTALGVTVAQQSRNIRVINGIVSISLTPNAAVAGSYYTAKYSSGGYIRNTERWNVPMSNTPLTIATVRDGSGSNGTGGSGSTGGGTAAPGLGQVQITDISGLSDELSLRPIKGTGFAAGRVAVINGSGALEGVSGNSTDCVRVDGSTGPCSSTVQFADAETPGGTMNGSNNTFTLAIAPNPATSLQLFRNGLLLRQGADYTLTGSVIQFAAGAQPMSGDLVSANYRY